MLPCNCCPCLIISAGGNCFLGVGKSLSLLMFLKYISLNSVFFSVLLSLSCEVLAVPLLAARGLGVLSGPVSADIPREVWKSPS